MDRLRLHPTYQELHEGRQENILYSSKLALQRTVKTKFCITSCKIKANNNFQRNQILPSKLTPFGESRADVEEVHKLNRATQNRAASSVLFPIESKVIFLSVGLND